MFKYLLICFAFITFEAKAWGLLGQQITVQVAEKYLTPEARKEIDRLLNGKRLSDLSTWADQIRRSPEWAYTGNWHYINVPDLTKNVPTDIVGAIQLSRENLSTELEDSQRFIWLKFLIHFIGDIHQPLHVGRPEDRGGNSTQVKFRGKSVNLHSLWDGILLNERKQDVTAFVNRLVSQERPTGELRKSFDPTLVVEENFKHRVFVYSYSQDEIDEAYSSKAMEIADERLWTGGMRLASALNEAFRK